MSNPFNFNRPTAPDKFLGRWGTVNEIVKDLYAAQGNSHAIIAGRRCGKTSLLHALQDQLLKRLTGTELWKWHVLPVLLDVQGLKANSPFSIYRGLVEEICLLTTKDECAFGDNPTLPLNLDTALIDKHYSEDASDSGLNEFKKVLGHIASKAEERFGPLRFIFLIDEVEEISEKVWTNELFGNLRSLTTNPRTSAHIRLVMAGSQRFLRAQRRPGSPLLNMFKQHHLEAFSDDITRELIAQGGEFPDTIIQEVITLGGGHPYIVQFLMHHLWDKREVATVEDVQAIGRTLCTQYTHILNGWCEAIEHSGRHVFKAMANTKDWIPLQTVQAMKDSNVEVDEGLTALLYHNLIIQKSKAYQYRCGSELFRQWFLTKQKIAQKPWGKGEKDMTELPPEVKAQAASFLFDIGRWAVSELKERWTLARQKKEAKQATEVDLSKPEEEVKQQSETLLQDLVTEHGVAKVERVLKLIEQRRKLVFEWRQAKLDYEEEYNRGRIQLAAFRRNQEDLDKRISNALAGIETDLKGLGVQVKKEDADQPAN